MWKPRHLHALRAIREACPALIDTYYVLSNPKYTITEITLMRPCRVTEYRLIKFDVDEEYAKWRAADMTKHEAQKEGNNVRRG